MAGPISEMKRVYKYVAPTSPAELIDCTNFTIDFENRKFLNVGFEPNDQFDIVLQIITPSRYVNISSDFLKRIYSVMGNILSHILDPAVKYKKIIFLEDEFVLLTSMVYKGEHVLVIESKKTNGCRILLNRRDLMTIQDLELAIFETISRKIDIVRPIILNQLDQISEFFKTDLNIDKFASLEEIKTIIKGIHIDLIAKHIPKNKHSFLSQIKLFATEQLAINWMTKNSLKAVDENDDDDELIRFLPPAQRMQEVDVLQPSPPRYPSMSPLMTYDEDDCSQSRAADDERGFREIIHSMDLAETRLWKAKSKAVDENDGPTYFNRQPSSPPSLFDYTDCKSAKPSTHCFTKFFY